MVKTKRPLAVTGFTVFITGSFALSMPGEYTAVLLALFALFIVIHYFTKRIYTKQLVLIFISAVTAVLYIGCYNHFYQQSIAEIPRDETEHYGYISAITNNEETGYNITLVDDDLREKYLVSIYYGTGFQLGDTVKITGEFTENKNNKYIYSNYSKNIKGKLNTDKMEAVPLNINTVKYNALTLRRKLLDSASQIYTGQNLAIVSAMGYSDKHLLSDSTKNTFAAAGISHALVVSGFHIGIIVLFLQAVMACLPVNKKVKNIAVALIIIGFMYLIGLTPSVIRAGAVAAVILIGANFYIEQDSITTLALVGFASILLNPYITRDIGAMLSYAAAAGIILAADVCRRREIKDLKRMLICAAAAVLFTLPILALADMKVTLLSPVFNLIFTIPVSVVCVLSVLTPLLNLIPVISVLNTVLVIANKYMIAGIMLMLGVVEKYFSFALLNLSHTVFLLTILAAVAAWFVAHYQLESKRCKNIFVLCVSILAFICYNLLNYNTAAVTVFDSGREASFHIQHRNKEYLVLSEWMTQTEASEYTASLSGGEYRQIYYCPKEFKYYTDFSDITEELYQVDSSAVYTNDVFSLKADISSRAKLFCISVKDCDIYFGHGKTECDSGEYYILGNDKPKAVTADEIYIFGNIPSWMEVENITTVDSDLTIKINLKTGRYKTVKDVFNFGYQL